MVTEGSELNWQRIRVCLLGDFRIFRPDGCAFEITNRRGRAILALLCLAPGEPVSRDQLAGLFWPGRFRKQALASLRQCLYELTGELKTTSPDLLDVSHSHVRVSPEFVHTDLTDLSGMLSDGDTSAITEALHNLSGKTLLRDLSFNDELKKWVGAKRLQIDGRLRILVNARLSKLTDAGDNASATELERAWSGFNRSTQSHSKAILAVLPFEQFDDQAEDFFLAEGAVDEICSRLNDVEGVALVGRTSINAVSEQGLTLPEITLRLNVSHIVEGTVRRRQNVVTLEIRLVDGAGGYEVWSDRLEGTVDRFVGSRQVIGANVISGLCGALGLNMASKPARRMTTSRKAYALYLQGRSLTQKPMIENALENAIAALEQALSIDPDFAECWTALAEAVISTIVHRPSLDKAKRSALAASHAQRALALNPEQGYAFSILSIDEWTRRKPAKALEYALKAYGLESQNPDVTMRLGSCLLYLGRTREALPYIEAAIEQDPAYGRNYAMLSSAFFNLGDFEAARDAGQTVADLGMPTVWCARAQAAMSDFDTAVATYCASRPFLGTAIMPLSQSTPMSEAAKDMYFETGSKGICSGNPEDREKYCSLLDLLHATLPNPHDHSIALPAVWMGHADLVMKLFREQIHPSNAVAFANLWSDTDPVRRIWQHPDFMNFAEEIGLVNAWEKFGWPDLIPADPRTN
jgi:TolB-like protein/cytochrome c-type biogenesis protein CcmH/NrfG